MSEAEFSNFKIEAILRAYFFTLFAELETSIRNCFKNELGKIDAVHKNRLYFYYGSTHSNTEYIDYALKFVVKTEKHFNSNEVFNEFSTIKIIKIDKHDSIIKKFNFEVNSLNKKTVQFRFHDVVIKLIEMRNILAHEPNNFKFKDKQIIELLSTSQIQENNSFYFGDYDLSDSNENNKALLSNLIYMKNLISNLS